MTMLGFAVKAVENALVPDALTRLGISALVERTGRRLDAADPGETERFARAMRDFPIAVSVDAANEQHYEVPADFFAHALGPQRKYSCCLYPSPSTTLREAEEFALAQTAAHADLRDGQSILELGCGWGSLSLWMARQFPSARILAVSNSTSQRDFIMDEARRSGLGNFDVVTADMNAFAPDQTFDRVVSVEMFEHMANWQALLARVRSWLNRDGRLFVHVFAHRKTPYRFDHADRSDWIAQHFFTGGLMPSHRLMHEFPDVFAVEREWWWSGSHYERTANDWLANLDRNSAQAQRTLSRVYGDQALLALRRWRMFFLATAGLFGHGGGEQWGVSHYLLKPA
jgi:cyclopropane-fatty-acyl-phospholipid synthase